MARPDPRPARPGLSAALSALVLAVALAGAAASTATAVDRLRADTAVTAVAQGEPGCVTAATFTDPAGVERSVDVTTYKSNCLDRDPGEEITVFYDSGDPSVTAADRAWWWSALVAVAALGLAGVAGRGLWLGIAAVRRARRPGELSS